MLCSFICAPLGCHICLLYMSSLTATDCQSLLSFACGKKRPFCLYVLVLVFLLVSSPLLAWWLEQDYRTCPPEEILVYIFYFLENQADQNSFRRDGFSQSTQTVVSYQSRNCKFLRKLEGKSQICTFIRQIFCPIYSPRIHVGKKD